MGGRPLGQHFLSDPSVIEQILDSVSLSSGQRVLEIGPGRGALTYPMLLAGAQVVAVEVDPKLAARLKVPAQGPGQLEIVQQDFLEVNLEELLPTPGWQVVANLPYYITTPILERLLQRGHGRIDKMWLMMQHEVAERIVSPACRLSGSLTHFVQYHAQAEYLFRIPPTAFDPPPNVESAVVCFRMKEAPEDCRHDRFFHILRRAFAQRRKMLRTSLKGVLQPEHFEAAGVDSERRPETLHFEEFLALERSSRQG